MPIAAVPAYLGKDFSTASPGMRFGMYLQLWGVNRRDHTVLWQTHDVGYEVRGQNHQEREVKYENKVSALSDAKRLNANDQKTMRSLLERQQQTFDASAQTASLRFDALTIAPFTTGLGNAHPLENGFAFLNPYGLPYLPGSGIKGVLRQAARELASGDWGETPGWDDAAIEALFGRESDDGDTEHLRGALTFWDVLPQIAGESLAVEIMTPHQSHYYQNGASPHESGQPIPITFLTVPPKSRFVFHVQCNLVHLNHIAPALAEGDQWKTLLTAAFEHAFQWLGFGAKTAVGYGAINFDAEAQRQADAERAAAHREAEAHAARQAALAAMTPNRQQVEAFRSMCETRAGQLLNNKENANAAIHNAARTLAKAAHEGTDWTADEKCAVADAIEEWLPKLVKIDIKDERKKLKLTTLRNNP